jgi:hypothetical protein
VPQDDRAKTSESGDPDPAVTAASAAAGASTPGDTPAMADSMSGRTGDDRKNTPNMGPVAGNRTPMIITLSILGLFVVMVAILVGASFFPDT